ncbi:MAG: DNA polymerase III subunit beta [Coriobacteriales bacterium]|jgi:DNA polymerase-3 subunit beta|nr:DNA polymerase III subunit beta [Coriobacteriales bacterium]
MKLTIEKERLAYSIKMVAKAMGTNSTIPVLSGIHINAASDGVIFETTDLDTSIRHIEEALIEEQGATVVPGKLFGDIVGSLPKEAVILETLGEKLSIRCGSTAYEIATLNPQDFPKFPQIIPTRSLELSTAQLTGMIKRVGKAVSRDVSRAVLTGVYFELKDAELSLVATDSYRLAIAKGSIESKPSAPKVEDMDTIIPGSILDEVGRLSLDEEFVTVGETENQVLFQFGSTTFIARKIEGNYPNYKQIIPAQKNVSVVVETEPLLTAVRRVSIVVKNASPIKFVLHGDTQQLEVSAQTPDIGEASESIPAQIDGEDMEIGFNHQYILDGLSVAGAPTLLFEAQTSIKPGIFKSIGSEDYFYLTMPVRLER